MAGGLNERLDRPRGGVSARAPVQIEPQALARTPAAALSIASNATLILLKLAAGAITGSVAIFTEALHSSIDAAPG